MQGLSKTIAGDREKQMDLDDVVLQGDPMLYIQNNTPKLGSVLKISKGGKKVNMLKGEDIQTENTLISLKELELTDEGTKLSWSGKHSKSKVVTLSGKNCHTIQPEVDVEDEKAKYVFDKGFIFDLGITMQTSTPSSSSSTSPGPSGSESSLKKCFHCPKMIPLEKMRVHVGGHIVRKECGKPPYRHPCGFCGRKECNLRLGAPTRRQKEVFYNKVLGKCPFMFHIAQKAKKASAKHPCLNYLQKCVQCDADVWHYNMTNHYEDIHPEFVDPPKVNPAEVKLMLKQK